MGDASRNTVKDGFWIESDTFDRMIARAIELGTSTQAIAEGRSKPYILQQQAHLDYGKGVIKQWCEQGIIKTYRDYGGIMKSEVRYSISELISASLSNHYLKDLPYEVRQKNLQVIELPKEDRKKKR